MASAGKLSDIVDTCIEAGDGASIQAEMERTSQALAILPVEQWAGWVIYILEVLDDQVETECYERFLEQLRKSVITRLETGGW